MTMEALFEAKGVIASADPTSAVVPAETRRTKAILDLEPVGDEISRRTALGLGAVMNRAVLGTLGRIPVDLPTPWDALSASDRRVLLSAPRGCVDSDGLDVYRRLVPAVRVNSAGVCARTWSDGLRQAASFASYCARYAVITSPLREESDAVMEARYFGTGLAMMLDGAESLTWLVQPAPFRPTKSSTAAWLFTESAVAAFVDYSQI